MRGNIWSVVALGTTLAFLPVVFSDELCANTDAVGTNIVELLAAFAPLLGATIIVAAAALLLALFSGDEF